MAFSLPFNLTGQPAASMPVAVSGTGLPIGMQIVAARFREDLVLRTCRAIESAGRPAGGFPMRPPGRFGQSA